mmetsp:Transcript_23453/g.60052  ORF Transcript_23453/g.60052 Transcript_23453/m.60052 type:complete len:87 (+) Transcript_23453:28-288(+)
MSEDLARRTWTQAEDDLLIRLINAQGGPKNWVVIAEGHANGLREMGLQPRSAKSCRLRQVVEAKIACTLRPGMGQAGLCEHMNEQP